MSTWIEKLAESLGDRNVDGWFFTYEFPGIFQFTKDETQVCCTPDYHEAGKIDIQVSSTDGEDLGGWDVPYVGQLSADDFISLMQPQLAKVIGK